MIAFPALLFYVFGVTMLASGIGVITARNPVHAALFLVLTFVAAAGLWLLLEAEFLAIALVLVYVGAVMVLFLFVVMMLDINLDRLKEGFWRYLPVAVALAALIAAEMLIVFDHDIFGFEAIRLPPEMPAGESNTAALGAVLYTDYVYPFQLAAVILLVAMVAAIALTLRGRRETKAIDPARQIMVRREDRVRLVSFPRKATLEPEPSGEENEEEKP